MKVIFTKNRLQVLVLIFVYLLIDVNSHGYAKTPRSRNWVAEEVRHWFFECD